MKDQLLDYNFSKRMKQIGFDEPCFGRYTMEKILKLSITDVQMENYNQISAPTHQQAIEYMERLTNNFMIPHNRIINDKKIYSYNIVDFNGDIIIDSFQIGSYSTPRESKESCISEFIDLIKKTIKVNEYTN